MMLLALGGCGHEAYKDNYPATSGVIVDGGNAVTASKATIKHTGTDTGTARDDAAGTILFMASPGDGKPARLIARTNSITTAPTAEFLAREAIASQRQAPVDSNSLTAPLVLGAGDDQAAPVLLPTQSPGQAGTAPRTDSHITIQRQSQGDGEPTILKIIEAP